MTKRKATHPNFEPKYTVEDKQRFFDALKETKGDVRAACKQSGFNAQTVRYWLKKAARDNTLDPETAKIVRRWAGNVDARLEGLLFKIFDSAGKKLEQATLPQQMEAADKIVRMLKTLRAPTSRDLPPPSPGQETAESEALEILARVEGRKGSAFETATDETEPETESVS